MADWDASVEALRQDGTFYPTGKSSLGSWEWPSKEEVLQLYG